MKYLEAMDAVSVEKVASASVFFDPKPGNTIVDVGMASGTSSSILAHLFPKLQIIGVDINPKMVDIASKTYRQPNLSFRADDGEKLTTFEKGSVHGFFNCSSIHHITSFNGYDPYDLENFILSTAISGNKVKSFSRLGKKFFPSIGVTPEQVYPYVVTLEAVNHKLKWVRLKEIYNQLELIRDGHLLICVMRLVHAMG